MLLSPDRDARKSQLHSIAEIASRFEQEFTVLDSFLESQVADFEPEIREPVSYTLTHRGKRIRPLLAFGAGEVSGALHKSLDDLVRVAAIVELVHLATLVHDDILDQAEVRHKQATVSEKYGSDAAVLVGDALFAHALKLASEFPYVDVCRAVSLATRRICAGEISQTFSRGQKGLSLEAYFRIIDLKTAELFSVSCALAARVCGMSPMAVENLGVFGRKLGVAYQIYDDCVDLLGDEDRYGKTLGTDLINGKMTLPVILLRQDRGEDELATLIEQGQRDRAVMLEALRSSGLYIRTAGHFEDVLGQALLALRNESSAVESSALGSLSEVLRKQFFGLLPEAA